jgi:CCR4-NOT transcriptional regulation complex NOT5 subunit
VNVNSKNLLETAKELLKVAKEKPEQFQGITKASAAPAANGQVPMKKDDMPHAPNTPQDKAHDVSENDDSLNHALKILDTPEKQKAMLDHLRTLHEQSQQRSPENQASGQPAPAQPPQMEKAEVIKLAKELIKAAQNPKQFEEMKKAMAAPKMAAPKAQAALPKPAAQAAPAMPKAPKMAGVKMSKDEIKADMASDWKPKFRKGKC